MAKAAHAFPGKVFLPLSAVRDTLKSFHLLDVRYYLASPTQGANEYIAAHIPESHFVDMNGELCGSLVGTTARHPLPAVDDFIAWCTALGFRNGRPALCYDAHGGGLGGCRLWWMLTALGVEAYVLAGGFQAYAAEAGLPVAQVMPEALTTQRQRIAAVVTDPAWKVDAVTRWPAGSREFTGSVTIDELEPNTIITDARAASRFSATVRSLAIDVVPGHIPGAVNLPWDTFVVDVNGAKMLKPESELISTINPILAAAGAPLQTQKGREGLVDASECVFSCGSGITACFNIALAAHLGLGRPKLYCGSWSEYAGRHKIDLTRSIVDRHGMLLRMIRDNGVLPNAAIPEESAHITVDGVRLNELDAVTAEQTRVALRHLTVGEEAIVQLRGGRNIRVAVEKK